MDVHLRLHGVLRQQVGGQPALDLQVTDGATVGEVLDALASTHPALERRIRDETGHLRQHVNLFVDAQQLRTLGGLDHRLHADAEILVLPAVSGGSDDGGTHG